MKKTRYLLFVLSIIISCERGEGVLIITSESEARAYNREEDARRRFDTGVDFDAISQRETRGKNYSMGKGVVHRLLSGGIGDYSEITKLRSTQYGTLRYSEHLLKRGDRIPNDVISDLTEIRQRGTRETYKTQAAALLDTINKRQGGITLPEILN